MNIHFIEALKTHLKQNSGGAIGIDAQAAVLREIDTFTASWPSSSDNPDNYPVTYHLKQYGDVTQAQMDEYIATGKIS